MSELLFDSVTVRYGSRRNPTTAVDDVTLVVPAGKVVGLVGESGSGKSTMARAAVGLAPIAGGRILLGGAPIRHRSRDRSVQMVFQDPYSSFNPRMKIADALSEAMPKGVRGAAARRETERLLDLVQLDPRHAESYPGEMSGGQRQRAALARALAGRPEVIIADEITSALDVSIQGAVLNVVRELQQELGFSMLFISHNLAVVRYVTTDVAVMRHGQIIERGATARVLENPAHDYTRELLAAVPGGAAASPDSTSRKRPSE